MENENITKQQVNTEIETKTDLVPEQIPPEEQVRKGIPLKTILLIILLTVVAGILLYVALPNNKKTSTNPTPTTQKAVNPADTVLSFGETIKEKTGYSTLINIDSGKNSVTAVQVEISYDPSVLTNVNIISTEFFQGSQVLYKKLDPTNGRISLALSVPMGSGGVKVKGSLAKITYTTSSLAVNTPLRFQPKTEVSGTDTNLSLLKNTVDGEVNIEIPTTQTTPVPTQ